MTLKTSDLKDWGGLIKVIFIQRSHRPRHYYFHPFDPD